jgi:hypothetical protein
MSLEALAPGLTFVLACGSAAVFLLLRCEGKGRPFGPRSRGWAALVIGLTGALSAGLAEAIAMLGHHAPLAILSLGIAAPSGLCLDRIREGTPDRRSTYSAAATLWLSWLLARMQDEMAEDKKHWCEQHIDPEWHNDELLIAAHSYHEHLAERLTDAEWKRYKVRTLLLDLESRLDIARVIDAGASRSRVEGAINASRHRRDPRYHRSIDDLTALGNRLRHDAERDLTRMLAAAYCASLYRLAPYTPPVRVMAPRAAGPADTPEPAAEPADTPEPAAAVAEAGRSSRWLP